MSKSSKNRAKLERLKSKRSMRAANSAKYEAWAGTDKNKKRKNWSLFSTKKAGRHEHAVADCGNIGCLRCHSHIAIPAAVRLRTMTHGHFAGLALQERLLNKYT